MTDQQPEPQLITLHAPLDVYARLVELHGAPPAERSDGLVEHALDEFLRACDQHSPARRFEVRLPPAAELITIDIVREVLE